MMLLATLVLGWICLLTYFVYTTLAPSQLEVDGQKLYDNLQNDVETHHGEGFLNRQLTPLLRKYKHLFIRFHRYQDRQSIEQLLIEAGMLNNMGFAEFVALRCILILSAFLLGVYAYILTSSFLPALFVAGLCAPLGYILPTLWLSKKGDERQQMIDLDIPSVLDLTVIAIEAGVTPEHALNQVIQTLPQDRPLREEWDLFYHQRKLGIPLHQGFDSLLTRNRSDQLHALVGLIQQATEMGVPLSGLLATFASDVRVHKAHIIKEKVGKIGPRIQLIGTFTIAFPILVLFVGMALLSSNIFNMFAA